MVEIALTGIEDRRTPWKYLIAGPPGAGKTAFASTAPNPWFLFFQDAPRLKSIADRSIPHSKIVNKVEDGVLVSGVENQMISVILRLQASQDYDTLVIDTLDEYQMRLKEERRIRNGGEWGVNDWNWLSDTFRETVQAIIDLPVRVIANVHVKTVHDEDSTYKELLLQGNVSDEAPGWFDIVGALDVYETIGDSGEPETRRVLLSSPNRKFPWLKDHSFQLPKRFELSTNFVGDVEKLETIVVGGDLANASRELIEVIDIRAALERLGKGTGQHAETQVVRPEELAEEKAKARTEPVQVVEVSDEETPSSEQPALPVADISEDEQGLDTEHDTPLPGEPSTSPPVTEPESSDEQPDGDSDDAVFDAAEQLIEEEIGTIPGNYCVECGEEVDENMSEISKVRYRRILCRTHYKTAGDE